MRKNAENKNMLPIMSSDLQGRIARMASYLSHEIKNPLSSIDIQLQLMKEKIMSVVQAEEQEKIIQYVRIISREIRRLDGIVDEFLHFSRPERLELRPCSLSIEIGKLLDLISPEADERKVQVETNIPDDFPQVECDPAKIRQVLLNLILNSFQAMPLGGVITISLNTNIDKTHLVCSVQDTGDGIAPQIWNEIFEPFFTLKNDGTGLGLSIVKRIIENHGGEVSVTASSYEGSTISFSLPIVNNHVISRERSINAKAS